MCEAVPGAYLQREIVTADFGLRDAKGRAIGHRAVIVECEVLASPAPGCESDALRGLPVGQRVWAVEATPTRDGERFGATHRAHHATTLEGARAIAAEAAAAARKRYVKAAG